MLPACPTDRPLRVSDPQRIRALSHPLRLELIDILGEGPATATRCAAATGESVASCSFHLRMLAKYGYIEPAPAERPGKPWQLTSSSQEIRPDANDPDSLRAVEAMAGVFVDREVEHIHRWLAQATTESPEWINALHGDRLVDLGDSEEMEELSKTLQALADRFEDRQVRSQQASRRRTSRKSFHCRPPRRGQGRARTRTRE